MMLNFNPELTHDRALASNQRSIFAHIDDEYYIKRFTPGAFVPFATAAHGTAGQSAGLGKWPTIDFPNAVSSYAVVAFARPKFWVSGKISITVYYTSQTAGVANFNVLLAMVTVPSGGNLSNTGVTALAPPALTATPGPAVADDEQSFEVFTTVSFAQSARRINLRVGRDGAGDANNNALQVTEVILRHIPAAQEVDIR